MSCFFKNAMPIWLENREKEVNLRVQFKTACPRSEDCVVQIATSGIYQLWINGEFVCYGPARAGKNYFRVDRIEISDRLNRERNTIIIEVAGYNANGYYIQNQPSFLQAEIMEGQTSIAWTGKHFSARINPCYVQKTQRYSFQRPMVESYRIKEADDSFFDDESTGKEQLALTERKQLIERLAPYPLYERISAAAFSHGTIEHVEVKEYKRDRSCTNISEKLIGFPISELDMFVSDEGQRLHSIHDNEPPSEMIDADEYNIYQLPYDASGMLFASVCCKEPITLYIMFDEILKDNRIDFLRLDCTNIIRYDLCPGDHLIHMFEIYTMKYVQFTAIGGSCTVKDVYMTEYKHPPVKRPIMHKPELQKIADAAIESFRQNVVDIGMDCPSRERAGWLCDSFFNARTEYCLTGKCLIEKSFFENFLHEEKYEFLPDGMLPMCYPADHYDGCFIPNWALWLVLQLKEYLARSNDRDLIDRFKPKVDALFGYFSVFENSDGLLERLDGWIFVEWSEANNFVQDVNYPTNMLYCAALRAAGELYGNGDYIRKSDIVKEAVLKLSFDGMFFHDNAVRSEGTLKNTEAITEVCQYSAFFFGIVTRDSHKQLFNTLLNDFGPERFKSGKWPQVCPAAPFVGNYMRIDILLNYGYLKKALENIECFFLPMAEKTGTLWEMAEPTASCNHGFAGYAVYWLDKINMQ